MSSNHAVIWVDHTQARVVFFDAEISRSLDIKTHARIPHLHTKAGSPGSGHAVENKQFFNEIAANAEAAEKILLVGPGVEKVLLVKHLMKHHPQIANKVLGIEASDHPSEAQLLAHARKFFVKADLYN